MRNAARDSTEDWLLPEAERPPTIAELERRIETALAVARASEAAAMTVADSALESAAQARRAAEAAERAAESAAGAAPAAARNGAAPSRQDWLEAFERRATDLNARFTRL